MAIFSQDYTKPNAQAFRDNDPVAAGTTGPYAPYRTDPDAYKNKVISNSKENPPFQQFYDQAFSAKSAKESQNKIDSFGDKPNFSNPGDQALAKKFLADYAQGVDRGLVPRDEMISSQTISAFQSKQPGQGINDSNVRVAGKLDYAGSSGIRPS